MTYWTPKTVEARLAEAVSMLGQQSSEPVQAPRPFSVESTDSETALLWFTFLEPEDAQLLWMRVERTPWKTVCQHFGVSRATANRRVEYLLSVIAWKLNHQRVPAKWSCRFLVERTRLVSTDM
jgi:hypothetical protein